MKRPTKQTRTSRLSLQTKLAQVVEQRDAYLEALETIADVLEEVGILDPEEEDEEVADILGAVGVDEEVEADLPPQQDESQHSEDDNPGDESDVCVGDVDPST